MWWHLADMNFNTVLNHIWKSMSSLCNLKCLQIAVQSTVCEMSDKCIYNQSLIPQSSLQKQSAFIPLTFI